MRILRDISLWLAYAAIAVFSGFILADRNSSPGHLLTLVLIAALVITGLWITSAMADGYIQRS